MDSNEGKKGDQIEERKVDIMEQVSKVEKRAWGRQVSKKRKC